MCRILIHLVSVVSLLFPVGIASAQNVYTWTGLGDGNSWCTPENWDPPGVSEASDWVYIYSLPYRGPVIDCSVNVGHILGPRFDSDSNQVMDIISGTIVVDEEWYWGAGGSGTTIINISGSPHITVNGMMCGTDAGKTEFNMSGNPTLICNGTFRVGDGGNTLTIFNIGGGSTSIQDDWKWGNDGDVVLNMSGGSIDIGTDWKMHCCHGANTDVNMTGGEIWVGGSVLAADSCDNTQVATIELSGGSINADSLLLPSRNAGTGILNMTGGLFTCRNALIVPNTSGGTGIINLDSGTIETASFYIDEGGTLDVNDGILVIDGNVVDDVIANINAGYITGYGGSADVIVEYNIVTNKTIVSSGARVAFGAAASADFESETPIILTVNLYNPPEGNTVTVEYAATGGTADGNGVDYTLAPGTLTFLPGGPTSQTIEITIIDDGSDEEDETIEITLSNPVNVALGGISLYTYTIIDPRPFAEFDAEFSRGREDVSPVNIPVSLSWLSTETVTVDYNVTGGTAASGEDYSLPAGTLQFDPCEVTKFISIVIVEDDFEENPDETIEITLSGPGNAKLGTNTVYTFTILPPTARICPEGDLDGDCEVDFNDLEIFVAQWLDPPGSCSDFNCADLDGTGGVNMCDYAFLAENWLKSAWPIVINEFMASNGGFLTDPLDPNETPDWFELYNASSFPVDLSGMYLTDDLDDPTEYEIPAGVTIPANGYLLFYADNHPGWGPMHTSFALSAGGEDIGLFDTDGSTLIDAIVFDEQTTDISHGRYPDAGDYLRFFATPTPEAENDGAYAGAVADTKFSHDRGFYESGFNLSITCNTGGAEIRYTTDGNKPTQNNGTVYTGPIAVGSTTCIRAAAFKPGYLATNVDTHTYIFGANSVRKVLPTISLVSGDLVGRTGPVSMELIYGDPNDGEGFQADCESEPHSVYSYRIKFKAEFGTSQLNYPFFEAAPLYADSAVDRFDRLVLRVGSQKPTTMVAEPWTRLTQITMSGPGHGGHSMYVHFYINGTYQGLINPVERPDAWFASSYFGGDFEDYFATNHNEDQDDPGKTFLSGDPNRYVTLLAMAAAKNLEDPNNYEDFKGLCDVIQFADYLILFWYADFEDGITNNYYAFMRNVPLEGSVPPEGLMYFMWDAEYVFKGPPQVKSAFFKNDAPMALICQALVENADFRILLADKVYKHSFNDGALTDENTQARWDVIYDHIASGGVTPYIDPNWRGISGSRDMFIDVLRDWSEPCWPGARLYPDLDPPTMTPQGGYDPTGFTVTMSGSDTIYYTLDGNDPREPVTGNPVGTVYTGPIVLNKTRHVKARVFDDSNWSALNEAVFAVGPVADKLRVTEIMYHPQDTGDPNDPNTEFIELKNIGDEMLNPNLVRFTNGVDFTFGSDISIPAGGYVVVVKDHNAFMSRYPSFSGVIAGEYTGRLNNAGERIELQDALGQTILNFRYEDGWRDITDGDGFSLTIIDPNNADPNSWSEKDSWRASAYVGGSPGWNDSGIIPNPGAVVINEVMAHSHLAPDWIELYNNAAGAIDIGGWFLSDSDSNLMKYEIAAGTTIEAGQYLVFYEDANFGNPNDPGCNIPFALSENGEEACLSSGLDANGHLTGYREVEDFGASDSNVSFGRYYKGSTGNHNFVAMDYNTPDELNAYPKVGPIVINEIMYHPDWPENSPYENEKFEYVELYNITDSDVNLYDEDSIPWKFTDGIDFTFPADTNIPGYGYLLVVNDPEAFAWRYGSMPPGVEVLGPYDGKLNNGGEKLEISMPGDVDEFGTRYYIRVDRVNYSDGSHPEDCPGGIDLWPTEADGDGSSLTRIDPNLYGNDPNNWGANIPSPGEVGP